VGVPTPFFLWEKHQKFQKLVVSSWVVGKANEWVVISDDCIGKENLF